jgi:pyruvate-ferredoxin/flavodoxin oxidoreductase
VLNLTMFRPFPADLVADLLRGRKGVTVLERVDQPLAVDPPLLREIRAAMGRRRSRTAAPAAARPLPTRLPAVRPEEVPDFYSGGFGFGSRDLQPGDLIAAVENMLPGGRAAAVLPGHRLHPQGDALPKLQIWQEQLLEAYPHLGDLGAGAGGGGPAAGGAIALRIHSVGGWGAITTGKNLAITCVRAAGLHVKANPKYGSEKKGQPTTFYATLSREPNR